MGGETPSIGNPEPRVYPRVGGETPEHVERRLDGGLSPRGRGNLDRFTAATAEDTVYPRVGGETLIAEPADLPEVYPAWAGKPNSAAPRETIARSIPAWAGKPR